MTVSSETKRKDYAGNGSTINFATGFRFLENTHVRVILTVDATGAESVQTETTNYTLTGAGNDLGGTVSMLVAPASGETLTIKRSVPLTQGTDYVENDNFPAQSHEDALDKLTMIVQQIQEELDRSLKLAESQQSSGLVIPVPVTGRFMQWDSNGNLQNVDIATQGALAVSDFAKTYLDDLSAPATRATLGLGSAAVSDIGNTAADSAPGSGSTVYAQKLDTHPAGPRNIIQYGTATTVKIRDAFFAMGGFRFHGNYKKRAAPVFPSASHQSTISTATDLAFGMSSVVLENWYGVFACADDGDANVTFRVVPFLRAESVATDVVTLRKAGESVHASAPQTYTWVADALNGAECLVITETVDGRAVAFSGRETTITDSTTTTVTLADIGTVAVGDWLLPAPNMEFDNYRYCGAFYVDTAEVRNIADSGTSVRTKGIFDSSGTNTGAVASPEIREPSGYISPLATAVWLQSTGNLSTTGTGQYVEDFGIDSAHSVGSFDMAKVSTASQSFNSGGILVPFSFGPQYYYSNGGGLAVNRVSGQQNLYGWIEP